MKVEIDDVIVYKAFKMAYDLRWEGSVQTDPSNYELLPASVVFKLTTLTNSPQSS